MSEGKEVASEETEGETRPRYRLYPFHADYSRMVMEFRPYVMYIHEPNYRSKAVNTDEMGFRFQYLNGDEVMRWSQLKNEFDECDLLVGNSTVFGVDAPSDKATISHHLNGAYKDPVGRPVINLGIRGATSQQELVMFQAMRRFLPPVRRIAIFSGIITASTIALPNSFIYDDFGAIVSEVYNFDLFCQQYKKARYDDLEWALYRFYRWMDKQLRLFRLLERIIRKTFGPRKPRSTAAAPASAAAESDREHRFTKLLGFFANDIENWSAMAAGLGAKVDFVLQPAINWTRKKLTNDESMLFNFDRRNESLFLDTYAVPEFYDRYRKRVAEICQDAGVPFHDANEWLNNETYDDITIFSDVCHLTGAGTELVAKLLREKIFV